MNLLAALPYRPFLDPMPLAWFDLWWLYLIPLSFFVSFTYKAVRMHDWTLATFARQTLLMTVQIILGMIGLAIASYLLVEIFVPWVRSW